MHIDDHLIQTAEAADRPLQASAFPGVQLRNCSWPRRCLLSICGETNATFDEFKIFDVNMTIDLDALVCFAEGSKVKIQGGLIRNNSAAYAVLIASNSSSVQILDSKFTGNSIAGLYVTGEASADISRSSFTNNTSDTPINVVSGARVNISQCHLIGNAAPEGAGCIYLAGAASVVLAQSNLSNNTAHQGPAGAISANENSTLDVTDTLFSYNSADGFGGGIHGLDRSVISIGRSSFVENRVGTDGWLGGGRGGGVFVEGNVRLRVYETLFLKNHLGQGSEATGWGGGLYAVSDAIVDISNCNFTGNGASKGGKGGALHAKDNARVAITGSHFKDNFVIPMGSGGGVYTGNYANVSIDRSEFVANGAKLGAGVCADESSFIIITNSSFRNNEAGVCCGIVGGTGGGAAVLYSASLKIGNSSFYNNTVGSRGVGGGVSGKTSYASLIVTGSTL
jgi:predicted outer membrane repeat protein